MEKLTDNEIIKALKKMIDLMCCEDDWRRASTIEDALDLINRQNEEIERLLKAINDKHCVYEKRVVTEAIKEFAESILDLFPTDKNFTTISRFTIKQKLKEMVGE